MRFFLKWCKVTVLTIMMAALPTACDRDKGQEFDISKIKIGEQRVSANINNESYYVALKPVSAIIATKIAAIVPKNEKPVLGRNYNFDIGAGRQLSDFVSAPTKPGEPLNVKVIGLNSDTSLMLKGTFSVSVNIVAHAISIADIKIEKQTLDFKGMENPTFGDVVGEEHGCSKVVTAKIKALAPLATINNDFTINIEGHKPETVLREQDYNTDLHVNVNAINNEYHYLLIGSFTFLITISK